MSEIENANKLFAEIGSHAPVTSVVFNEKAISWIFRLEGDIDVTAAFEDTTGLISFAMPLGPVPGANAAEVHRLLLRFSFLWRETGGLFAALDETEAPVMLYRCSLANLDTGVLAALLNGLMRQRDAWSQIIAQDDAPVESIASFMPQGGIRV